MAMTPCSAREAKQILATAAASARVAVVELAGAIVAGARGVPVPAHVERALRRAVETARTPAPAGDGEPSRRGLLPSRASTGEILARFRDCRARLSVEPADEEARRAMDDVVYTLCVLMGRSTAHDAVTAAERHLADASRG
ncbi:DUF5133 domain-containing protein [Streptomyces sp. NPDC003042]